MGTQAFRRHGTTAVVPRWIIVALLSGAASVLVFHQGALALLNAAALTDRAAYSMQGAPPFGVPEVWSLAFWGALWGRESASRFSAATVLERAASRLGPT